MQRFLEYEAYAAYSNLMGENPASINASGWQETEKGIEALSVLTLPSENHIAENKKALTFSDLTIKVIVLRLPLSLAHIISQFNVSVNIHCFSTIYADIPQLAMTRLHTQNWKRFFLGFNELQKTLTKRCPIPTHASELMQLGCYRID
jgi:hypothetical protein